MKYALLFSTLLFTQLGFAIPVGFNQAWFHNNYGTQYLDGVYDEVEVERIFKLTQEAGAKNLRLWFFESADFPMLVWENNQLLGIRQDFIRNIIQTLQIAKNHDVKVYMTFLDAHSYRPDQLRGHTFKRLRKIYQAQGGEDFLHKAIGPLLNAIEQAGLSSSIGRIDLSNEMDAVVNRFGFDYGWSGAKRMLCQWRAFIQSFSTFKSTPVTFSLRLHPLIFHPANLLDNQGPMMCADFLDFHSYSNSGKIHRCQQLRNYTEKTKKDLVLGEFGQGFFNHSYNDHLHTTNTAKFIQSAKHCGFVEALAWRLSDVRPGFNKEARYSFEAFNQMRPAYHVIRDNNLHSQ